MLKQGMDVTIQKKKILQVENVRITCKIREKISDHKELFKCSRSYEK